MHQISSEKNRPHIAPWNKWSTYQIWNEESYETEGKRRGYGR